MIEKKQGNNELFNSYSENYATAVDSAIAFTGLSVDFVTKVKANYIRELCAKHFGEDATIKALDVGCGVGSFHALLEPAFSQLHGIDVSTDSISKATEQHPKVSYQSYDGFRLPYADNYFDLVFTVCVMHHVPPEHWAKFASEMNRVVRSGGLALVFEHNPRNPLTRRAVNNCPFDKDAVLLNSQQTIELFQKAGFTAVDDRFILSLPAATPILQRLDRLFSKLPFGAQYYVHAEKP